MSRLAEGLWINPVDVLEIVANVGVTMLHGLGRHDTGSLRTSAKVRVAGNAALKPVMLTSAPLVNSASTVLGTDTFH